MTNRIPRPLIAFVSLHVLSELFFALLLQSPSAIGRFVLISLLVFFVTRGKRPVTLVYAGLCFLGGAVLTFLGLVKVMPESLAMGSVFLAAAAFLFWGSTYMAFNKKVRAFQQSVDAGADDR